MRNPQVVMIPEGLKNPIVLTMVKFNVHKIGNARFGLGPSDITIASGALADVGTEDKMTFGTHGFDFWLNVEAGD